jgi:hypothetical protein
MINMPAPLQRTNPGFVAGLLALLLCAPRAFAGPPFQTDDPEPVDYRHFEMYAFTLSDSTGHNAGGTVLTAPAYEVNYGAAPNLQLHLVIPFTTVFQPMGNPTNFGLSDTELGFKYRFVPESKRVPQVGIFPFFELPSGNADRALGVGKTWYRIPVWLQKSWGEEDHKWTTYGGGGYTIVPQDGYTNFPFAGWLIQRDISKKLMLGTELFGHGAEGDAATSSRSSTMLDLGGTYEFKEGFDLLFCGGRSVHGQPESYAYLALYWTWGPGGAGEGEQSGGKETHSKMPSVLTHLR